MSAAGSGRGALVMVPVALGETPWSAFLPPDCHQRVSALRHFVVETEKTARAQLKRLAHPIPLRELDIQALPERATDAQLDALLAPTRAGDDVGLMSDAGCPGVADPGARLVARAHRLGITVSPLVGPSSLLLALMGSGLNGQSFAFHGYLPVEDGARKQRIRALEDESRKAGRTQLVIETPYRNDRLFSALLESCRDTTLLCVARDVTTAGEWIVTRRIVDWRQQAPPDLTRRPTVFLILAEG